MAINEPISIKDFEDAVHAWLSSATDLTTIWAQQSKARPDYPYASLNITAGPTPVTEGPWELRTNTDLGRPAGEEIEMNACVPCTFSISCQAYVAGDNANDPTKNARYQMTLAQAALRMDSFKSDLNAAGISVMSCGPVQNINQEINKAFVSRANLDVVFGAALNAIEYTGYISQIQLINEEWGIDEIIST